MSSVRIKLTGMGELYKALKQGIESREEVKSVVRKNAGELQGTAVRLVPKDTHFLERSIGVTILDGGYTAEIMPTADYAAYVEYGTRYMGAQPYMRPALEKQKPTFYEDVAKIIKDLQG